MKIKKYVVGAQENSNLQLTESINKIINEKAELGDNLVDIKYNASNYFDTYKDLRVESYSAILIFENSK